jgi:hypothetical protein
MKRLLVCSLVALTSLSVACTDEPTPGADASTPDGGASADGGTSTLGFRPSNLDSSPDLEAALADPTLGDLDLSDCGPQAVASENGRLGCAGPGEGYRQIEGFGGGLKYAVFVARSVHVAAGMILEVGGDRPLIIVARESITIDGSVQVKEGFAGAYALPGAQQDGAGPGAGKGSSDTTSGSGGGGAFCGKGGNGGAATATGGAAYGTAELIPLQGGSSGGGLFAAGSFIDARGGGAVAGGGSGGAILLEAPTVKVLGSLTANGGGGGAPGGESGKPGERTATPATGGRNAASINGGDGSAGTQVDGTSGALNTMPPNDGTGSASGAGGAGRVRINTRSGAAEVTGLVSPALGSACGTQGTLR